MRLQIRPNGPLLLAKAWAAGRSCSWAPRPAQGPIIPDDRSAQERAASLSFLAPHAVAGFIPPHRGGGLGGAVGALRLGLGVGFAFFGRAFCRFAPKLPLSPPRAPAARGADRIGALPSSFPHPQSRSAKKAGRKRGKEEQAGKAGKTGIKAAEGLREPRKEWRRRQSGGHKKSPEKSGLAGEGGAVDRDRPPAA